MSRLKLTIAMLLLPLCSSIAFGGAVQHYTATQGPRCKDVSRQHMTLRICAGPAGYEVTLGDEGNVAAITFSRPGYIRDNGPTAAWRGADRVFGDLIEWRTVPSGKPYAAILRTWEMDEQDKPVGFLRVFALTSAAACEYGKVRSQAPNANLEAAELAGQAARHDCSGPHRGESARPEEPR